MSGACCAHKKIEEKLEDRPGGLTSSSHVCLDCGAKFVPQVLLKTAQEEIDRQRVQLAGCLAAAEGATNDPAPRGSFGWSVAYQSVLQLRLAFQKLTDRSPAQVLEKN